ncbi:MAG: hypothetical protein HYT98_02025 [Candidatus Sungbacteria bacterium]|nr:hypothetical protein [Candidatus Sungbacteria bacterium]
MGKAILWLVLHIALLLGYNLFYFEDKLLITVTAEREKNHTRELILNVDISRDGQPLRNTSMLLYIGKEENRTVHQVLERDGTTRDIKRDYQLFESRGASTSYFLPLAKKILVRAGDTEQ